MIDFGLILLTCLAGYASLGWWVVLVSGLALHLTMSDTYRSLLPRFERIGRVDVLLWGWGASITQALIATSAAFAVGRLVAWWL